MSEADIVVVTDENGSEVLSVSSGYTDLFPPVGREEIGEPFEWIRFVEDEKKGRVENVVKEIRENGLQEQKTVRYPLKDADGITWMETDFCPVFEEEPTNGQAGNRIICLHQILSEEQVQKGGGGVTKAALLNIVENLDEVIFLVDRENEEYLFFNEERYEEIYGGDAEKLSEDMDDYLNYVHPDDREDVENEVAKLISGQRISFEYRVNPDEDYERWVWSQGIPIKNEDGNVIRTTGFVKDITKKKKVEQNLRKSENRLRTITENIDEVIYIANEDWSEMFVNRDRYEEVFGGDYEDLMEDPFDFLNYVHPDDRERVETVLQELQEGIETSVEYRVNPGEDYSRWVWGHGVPVFDDAGNITQYTGFVKDITRRKEMQQQLAESEERFRQLAENIEEVFYLRSVDPPEVIYVSPAYEKIWGDDPEEVYRDPRAWKKRIHPEDRAKVDEEIGSLTEANEYSVEYRIIRDDGEVRWIRNRGFPVQQEGYGQRLAGIAEDVTEFKEVQEELRESEEKFRQLAEHVDLVFWMSSADVQDLIYISPPFEEIWGLPREEVLENPELWIQSVHPEDREVVDFISGETYVEKQPEELAQEYRIVRPDDEIRWIRDRAFPVRNENGEVYRFAGVAEDITELKEKEEQLKEAQDKLDNS